MSRSLSLDSALVASQTAPPDGEPKSSDDTVTAAVADGSGPSAVEPMACEDAVVVKDGSESDALVRMTGSIDGVELVTLTGELFDTDPDVSSALVQQPTDLTDADAEEYDPWESFNEKMFKFNYNFDKYLLKPVAKGYNVVMPDELQRMIGNAFDNINPVPKWANNLLQRRYKGFFTELGRFLINSTLGIGGLWDIAKQEFGLQKTRVDFGQTLGKWGFGPGPFLVLPFLPPLTVRDGIGYGVDGAMDPLSYFIPFIWDRLGMRIGDTVNDRSLNLDLFQGFEESTIDMYSAVRNGYLQRRYNLIHAE